MGSIYGEYKTTLEHIKNEIVEKLLAYQDSMTSEDGEKGFEHISARVKSEESMREKCIRKELPEENPSERAFNEAAESYDVYYPNQQRKFGRKRR